MRPRAVLDEESVPLPLSLPAGIPSWTRVGPGDRARYAEKRSAFLSVYGFGSQSHMTMPAGFTPRVPWADRLIGVYLDDLDVPHLRVYSYPGIGQR